MIYFDVFDAEVVSIEAVYLNGHKMRQWVTCEYKGEDHYFTSVARARHWAENVVHQNYEGLPRDPERQGGWRTSTNTEKDEDGHFC